jgi:hypothetical protein
MRSIEAEEELVAKPEFKYYQLPPPSLIEDSDEWSKAYDLFSGSQDIKAAQKVCHTSNLYFATLFAESTRLGATHDLELKNRLAQFYGELMNAFRLMRKMRVLPSDEKRLGAYLDRLEERVSVMSALIQGGPFEANLKTTELSEALNSAAGA